MRGTHVCKKMPRNDPSATHVVERADGQRVASTVKLDAALQDVVGQAMLKETLRNMVLAAADARETGAPAPDSLRLILGAGTGSGAKDSEANLQSSYSAFQGHEIGRAHV